MTRNNVKKWKSFLIEWYFSIRGYQITNLIMKTLCKGSFNEKRLWVLLIYRNNGQMFVQKLLSFQHILKQHNKSLSFWGLILCFLCTFQCICFVYSLKWHLYVFLWDKTTTRRGKSKVVFCRSDVWFMKDPNVLHFNANHISECFFLFPVKILA